MVHGIIDEVLFGAATVTEQPITDPQPRAVDVDGVQVTVFADPPSLFARIAALASEQRQSVVAYLNVHVANCAADEARLKSFLQQADVVYCDGAGVRLASLILGDPLPTRLTAADWFPALLRSLADAGLRVFLLGASPGVAARARTLLDERVPGHSVVGVHHGFLQDPAVERAAIDEINRANADVLIVGMGTPTQERWIADHRSEVRATLLYAIGAVLDFFADEVPRCPPWMGRVGLEWAFRLWSEPSRLGRRYLLGNPRFIARIIRNRWR